MKSKPKNEWWLTDDDCYQWMTKFKENPSEYKMIQTVWFDVTQQDKENGVLEYCVVAGYADTKDFTPNDIDCALAGYGYSMITYDPLRIKCGDGSEHEMIGEEAWDMVAECYLEDSILLNSCIVFESDDYDECRRFVDEYIMIH